MESVFRIIHCGFTQPLKLGIFLYGWIPSWFIYFTKFVGDFFVDTTAEIDDQTTKDGYWLNKDLLCSLPVHLDLTVLFGLAIFIVMCNSAR